MLTSSDSLAFRVHSQLLQLKSWVMTDLLEEHSDQLQLEPDNQLRIPFGGPASSCTCWCR